MLAQANHQERTEDEEDRRQEVREPEADVLLRVDHGDLACQGTDVDEEVVPHVDAGDGDARVDDNPFTTGLGPEESLRMAVLVLFGDKRRDAGLEEANTAAEQDQADDEGSQGTVRVGDDLGNSGYDDQDVTNCGEDNGHIDGFELSPVFVGNPAAWKVSTMITHGS